jgi:predicted Zn-dependent peptidase
LRNEDVSAEELQSVKTRAKADLVRQLDNNQGLAIQLAQNQTLFGDWRELFREIDKIDKVSAADVRRIANKVFTANNRTVGMIESNKTAAAPATGGTK